MRVVRSSLNSDLMGQKQLNKFFEILFYTKKGNQYGGYTCLNGYDCISPSNM